MISNTLGDRAFVIYVAARVVASFQCACSLLQCIQRIPFPRFELNYVLVKNLFI